MLTGGACVELGNGQYWEHFFALNKAVVNCKDEASHSRA